MLIFHVSNQIVSVAKDPFAYGARGVSKVNMGVRAASALVLKPCMTHTAHIF
jgi:hypothetical protein